MNTDRLFSQTKHLPAYQIADSVNQKLTESSNLVITAPPGAGKSTLLPLTILNGCKGKILMLEPRRLAARQIAERMASILGESVGKTVGYRIRFENKTSADTRIEVLTEGILTRMLVNDPTLDGVSIIIFDEFHERSINSDLALALARQAQEIIRPDLKLVIMSATIDTTTICQTLQAPLIESQGKIFPVETVYASEDINVCDMTQEMVATIAKAHHDHPGDILAFLPGQGEILKCEKLLNAMIDKACESSADNMWAATTVYPLYGNLSPEKQRSAIAPSQEGRRKIVLATPIAETSLTIEGVRIVIDSGLCRKLVYDNRTGLSQLKTVRISKDMATQRKGRAGRVAEGICYRLWTKTSEHLMENQRCPEIEDADLSSMVLDIAAFGENKPECLPWFTLPPTANLLSAKNLLVSLKAIREDGNITALGKKMASLPCHPRIARMMLNRNSVALACDIAALLEEKDPMSESSVTDIALRISILRSLRRKSNPGKWNRIAQIAQEYRRMLGIKEDNGEVDAEEVGNLIAQAYPERIAMAADNIGNFRMANGNMVFIDKSDPMSAEKWIAIASLNSAGRNVSASGSDAGSKGKVFGSKGKVFLCAPVSVRDLPFTEVENISWDSKAGMVKMQMEHRIGKLVIDSKPIQDADKQRLIDIICNAARKDGLSMFDWNENVQRLQRRVAKVSEWHPELEIPDFSTEKLLSAAADWLPFYLEDAGRVMTSISEMKKINLEEALWALIPYNMQQEIERLAPTHLRVPSGRNICIDYRQGAEAPILSVRLQECFGMTETPTVNDGKQPLLMELLSPGFKPVQLTQDLHSFWEGTYFEVRKELKRRYPKHFWPDNPLESEAVRGVKKNK